MGRWYNLHETRPNGQKVGECLETLSRYGNLKKYGLISPYVFVFDSQWLDCLGKIKSGSLVGGGMTLGMGFKFS